jgi:hypothetical protein
MTYYGAKEPAEAFRTVGKNTIQVAEDIPEGKYSFKAADDVRTVEKMLTHIALMPRFQSLIHSKKLRTCRNAWRGFRPRRSSVTASE